MKKGTQYTGITLLIAAFTGCVLASCTGSPFRDLKAPGLPSSWTDKRPVLDLTRSFSFVVPGGQTDPANPIT